MNGLKLDVMIVREQPNDCYWSQSNGLRSCVEVVIDKDQQTISLESVWGSAPQKTEAYKILGDLMQLSVYQRTIDYRFVKRYGSSGSYDIFIETVNNNRVKRKFMLHVSMADKINEGIKPLFIYDLADFLVCEGVLLIHDDKYTLCPFYDCSSTFKVLRKREVEKEDGWNKPGEYKKAVNLSEEGVIVYED